MSIASGERWLGFKPSLTNGTKVIVRCSNRIDPNHATVCGIKRHATNRELVAHDEEICPCDRCVRGQSNDQSILEHRAIDLAPMPMEELLYRSAP